MSLVSRLLQNAGTDEYDNMVGDPSVVYESETYFNAACADLLIGINQVSEAYDVADIIASVKVVTEGADPSALLEANVRGTIDFLRKKWEDLLQKIKNFFAKVIDFFKSLVVNDEKFVKEYGDRIKAKTANIKDGSWKYKGFTFTIDNGDTKADDIRNAADAKMKEFITNVDRLAASNSNSDTLTLGDVEDGTSSSDVVTAVIKSANIGGAENASDLKKELRKAYRNGKDAKEELTISKESDVTTLMNAMKDTKSTIAEFKREQSDYDASIKRIIAKLKFLSTKKGNDTEAANAKKASKISSLCGSLISVCRIATNVKIDAYKSQSRQSSAALRKFFRSGFVSESVMFEGDELDDIDLSDDDVVEACNPEADDPVGDPDDIGVAGVSECGDSDNLLEEAMKYI